MNGNVAVLIGAVALVAVFALAGIGKLLDPRGSREAARSFGVPDRLAGLVSRGLPLAELAIALLLLPLATRWWAAAGALALLLVFSAAIGIAMMRGQAPECHCFGQLHSAPVGWRTLLRNLGLVAVAAFVVVAAGDGRGASAFAWPSTLDARGWIVVGLAVALAAATAAGGYVVLHLLRSYGRVLLRLDAVERRLRDAGYELDEGPPELGLAPGTPAPAFWLPDTTGDRVALGDLLEPGRPLLLLFTSPSCTPCSVLMPEVTRWQEEHADELTIALLSDGNPEAIRAHADEHGVANVLVDETLSAYESYEANGTPSAVLVGDDGLIASWLAAGADWIETLVDQALGGLGRTPGLPVGADVPRLGLLSLDGVDRELAEVVDGSTVVLFWNPQCGYCGAMHDDVVAWERSRPSTAPSLVVVSSGATEDVREEGFSSTVLLDPDWQASSALGADGTPMALLLDREGRIASPLVTGATAILELLGADQLAPLG